jgi:predicted PurR-regulated permease PerM
VPTRALTWAIFVAAAGIVAAVCVAILRPFANVIAWSAVLAIVCYPLQEALVRRTGRVALSAFLTSIVAVAVWLVPLLVLAGVAVNECIAFAHSLSHSFQDGAVTRASALIARITRPVGLGEPAIAAWVDQRLSGVARGAGQYTITIATGLFDAVMSSVFVICAMFLLLRDGKGIVEAIPDLLPFERNRSKALLGRITEAVYASVHGVVVIALLQGVLCGVMCKVLGIPAAALWGAVTVFASVLPVVGAFAVWGPGVLYLVLTGSVARAIVLALWGTFVVSGIDNVLRPRLVAGRVGLSELAMFFALLGGLSVFGALGVVLGPVAFATAAAIVQTLRQPAIARPFSERQS